MAKIKQNLHQLKDRSKNDRPHESDWPRHEKDQTELLVIVTADMVEPLDDGFDRPVPGDLHQTPDDWDLFGEGRLDGDITHLSPLARLESLGLEGLVGPGAWRRPDDTREAAGDPLPASSSNQDVD